MGLDTTAQTVLDADYGEFSKLLDAIARASLAVQGSLAASRGLQGGKNVFGEVQTKIDVFANEAFCRSLLETGDAAEVASEEMEESRKGSGPIHISMDPLDGSSNIATNNVLGSIFGLYDSQLPCSGKRMLGAAFVTYGPLLTLTVALGRGVQRYVAAPKLPGKGAAFELLDEALTIPEKQEVFGLGGLRRDWIPEVEAFVRSLEARGVKLRYGGTFVGDYNQVLEYGGIFGYPALKNKPRGKLRLLYEAAPMAFVTREAGGYASDGRSDILFIEPKTLAETTPVYLGTPSLVRELEGHIAAQA